MLFNSENQSIFSNKIVLSHSTLAISSKNFALLANHVSLSQ